MRLGSLFDGSGGFPLSGALCGIEPIWASEVEPYPIAVTKSRFPNMKHLGDISKINGAEIEPVDIITFGSPCQDLSVAGKRAGLKHEDNGDDETTRSGLFIEAVRIIKEMREKTNGEYPRFAVWENVPGAFSSNKGEDFRIVLEELIKIVEPNAVMPEVPRFGWAYADSYCGNGWSLAYRVLDAQYWGVPQRRRRIYLVADLGGQCAREILFEREGLRGYFTKGRTPWKATPANVERGIGADDREGETAIVGADPYNGEITSDKSSTLGVNCGMSSGRQSVIAFKPGAAKRLGGYAWEDVAGTLRAEMGDNQTAVAYGIDHAITTGGNCTAQGSCVYKDVQATLKASGAHAVAYGVEPTGDKAKTLNSAASDADHVPCTVYSVENHPNDSRVKIDESGKVQSLTSRMGTEDNITQPLKARDYKDPLTVVYGGETRYIVRRLTPTECARLQGFADRWGDINTKTELSDEEYKFWLDVRNTHATINGKQTKEYTKAQMLTWYNKLLTDSAEYKMWGNGIALPTALYVIQGIAETMKGANK